MHRASAGAEHGAELATVISAAFRLPWDQLEPLLYEIMDGVKAGRTDWSSIELEARSNVHIAEERAGVQMSNSLAGLFPPWGDAVDAKSVAAFPLQLKHAGCYLGSSLNQNLSSSIPTLSAVLGGALAGLGLAPGGAARGVGHARTALVGDAAHTTHPLAGQGLNLGIQDVRALTDAISDACNHGMDIGTHNALAPYERARYLPNQAMLSVTDHLHWLFATRPDSAHAPQGAGALPILREAALKALVWTRSTGLEIVNELSPLKRLFAQTAGSK